MTVSWNTLKLNWVFWGVLKKAESETEMKCVYSLQCMNMDCIFIDKADFIKSNLVVHNFCHYFSNCVFDYLQQ